MEKMVSRPFSIVERVRWPMVECGAKPLQVPRTDHKSPVPTLPRNACWRIVVRFWFYGSEGTWLALRMKSHTPECAKIEQFVATLASTSRYDLCMQDFDSKDTSSNFRLITITQQQFDDGVAGNR